MIQYNTIESKLHLIKFLVKNLIINYMALFLDLVIKIKTRASLSEMTL